jgi:hypothetical protein
MPPESLLAGTGRPDSAENWELSLSRPSDECLNSLDSWFSDHRVLHSGTEAFFFALASHLGLP